MRDFISTSDTERIDPREAKQFHLRQTLAINLLGELNVKAVKYWWIKCLKHAESAIWLGICLKIIESRRLGRKTNVASSGNLKLQISEWH